MNSFLNCFALRVFFWLLVSMMLLFFNFGFALESDDDVADFSLQSGGKAVPADSVPARAAEKGQYRMRPQGSLVLKYLEVRPSGLHVLEWSGRSVPSLGDVIKVGLGAETIGYLVIFRLSRKSMGCRFIGEEIDHENLRKYTLRYLGVVKDFADSRSLFAPGHDLPTEHIPQLALSFGTSFGNHDFLEVIFENSLERRLDAIEFGVTVSPPPLQDAIWMNWFFFNFLYQLHTTPLTQVVVGENRQTAFTIEDDSSGMQFRLGVRVPFRYRLMSSIELYGVLLSQEHKMILTSTLANESAQVNSADNSVQVGATYTMRLLDNLFVSLFYQQTVDSQFEINPEKEIVRPKLGSADRMQYGVIPYIYYEISSVYPKMDLRLEFGISQAETSFKLIDPDTQERSLSQTEHLKVQSSIRLGVLL